MMRGAIEAVVILMRGSIREAIRGHQMLRGYQHAPSDAQRLSACNRDVPKGVGEERGLGGLNCHEQSEGPSAVVEQLDHSPPG